jgi:hypothetical protein
VAHMKSPQEILEICKPNHIKRFCRDYVEGKYRHVLNTKIKELIVGYVVRYPDEARIDSNREEERFRFLEERCCSVIDSLMSVYTRRNHLGADPFTGADCLAIGTRLTKYIISKGPDFRNFLEKINVDEQGR